MRGKGVFDLLRFGWRITDGRFGIALLVTLGVGLTETISLVLLIPIVASAAPEQSGAISSIPVIGQWLADNRPPLWILLTIFVILVSIQALLTRAKGLYNQAIMHDASDHMRITLFETVGLARWDALRRYRSGDLNHVLTDDAVRTIAAMRTSMTLFQAGSTLVITLALAALISWQMTVFAAVVGSLLFLALNPVRRRANLYGKEMTELFESQNHTILEFLQGLRTAKLFNAEDSHLQSYRTHLQKTRESVISFLRFSTTGTLAFQIGSTLIAATFVWLAIEVFALDIPRLVVLLVIFMRLVPRFNTLQQSTSALLSSLAGFRNYRRAVEYFEAHQETVQSDTETAPHLLEHINANSVTVEFEGMDRPALDSVTLSIERGMITGLIGPSGSGKSTLADLLAGLTAPSSGTICVDDVTINHENRRAWRGRVACVPQDVFMLNSTVIENLRIGKPDATIEQIWGALEKARVADLIRSLPEGLDAMAGERGSRFSGGERQRLALARALLAQPSLLILDEATSALDWENQTAITEAILALKGEITCLVIAHRGSLVTIADRIIALNAGRILETGSFSELSKKQDSQLSQFLKNDSDAPAL